MDGSGEGDRGRPLSMGSSSLRLELSGVVTGNVKDESTGIGMAVDVWCSSFKDDPSIEGLSKLTDDDRDSVVGWRSEEIKLFTTEEVVDVRPLRFGTRTRSNLPRNKNKQGGSRRSLKSI